VRRAFALQADPFELYRFPMAACVIFERVKINGDVAYSGLLLLLRTEGTPTV